MRMSDGLFTSVNDLACRTNEATHILHHADDWQLDLLTEPDLLSHILQRHFLQRDRVRWKEKAKEREQEKGPKEREMERKQRHQ